MRDDVEGFAEEFVEELETAFFGVVHEAFAGAVAAVVHDLALAAADGDAGEDGHEK